MAALLAKRYGCQQALTLVNNNVYGGLLGSLGIDVVVNPRETTVSSMLQHVRRGRIKSVYSLRDGEAEVFEAEALETSPLVGQPLREARLPGGVHRRRDRARRRGDHAARRHRDPGARPRGRGGARRGGQEGREAVRGAASTISEPAASAHGEQRDGTHRLRQRPLPAARRARRSRSRTAATSSPTASTR